MADNERRQDETVGERRHLGQSERSLPGWIGLCPDVSHADEFYIPEPKLGEKCPWCSNELIVYRQDEKEAPPLPPPTREELFTDG